MATVPTTDTVSVGEKITAANYNTFTRDAVAFLISPPRVFVYQTATTTTTTAVATTILFDTEQYDTDTMHSTSTNTGRITATTTGLYHVVGQICMASNATGTRTITLIKNGTTNIASDRLHSVVATNAYQDIACDVQLTAGDYVELAMIQTSGGNLATVAGASNTWFSARWVANS